MENSGTLVLAAGPGPSSAAGGDLDGDGNADLVVTSGEVLLFRGDGEGGLEPAGTVEVGPNPVDVAVADLDGDGDADLAVAHHEERFLTLLLGVGDGTFRPADSSPLRVPVRPHLHAVRAADLDRDGHPDLLVDDREREAVLVLPGRGDGTFGEPVRVPVGGDPYRGMALGDLDGDGRLDLVTPNPTEVGVWMAEGSGPAAEEPGPAGEGPDPAAGGSDPPAEGSDPPAEQSDPAAGGSDPSAEGPRFAFRAASPVPAPAPFTVALGDLDGDGRLDLVTGSEHEAAARLYLGDAKGGFEEHADSPFAMGRGAKRAVTGDFDGDGIDDAAVASYLSPDVLLLLGGGDSIRTATVPGGVNPWALAAVDLDGDGRDELVVGDEGEGHLRIHRTDEAARP